MMPPKPKRNSVKPLYSRAENPSDEAPAMPAHPDLQDEEEGETTQDNETSETKDTSGDSDNEPTDEEIVDSLVEGLTPEQKSLLLQKLQEDSSKTQTSNEE